MERTCGVENFADRLSQAIEIKRAPVCVGLDPLIEKLPPELRASVNAGGAAEAILQFGRGAIEAIAVHVPAIKINIAFFEPYGPDGLRVYHDLVAEAHKHGLVVIGDIKRADIGHTSAQYAAAHLQAGAGLDDARIPDSVTVNPYFGSDGVQPFIDAAKKNGRGVFVLVQTSNESAAQVQGLKLPDGMTVCQHVAQLVQSWAGAEGLVGRCGYSAVGAVVSPRDLESTVRIRGLMPNCVFLVPGFGAQGRTAEEVAKCFKPDGSGAIVTASRSVIFAYGEPAYRNRASDWRTCIGEAASEFVNQVRSVCPTR
ncbi:MAG: orotidine-5'-phosphate decarboxylase [Planctomycetes bacterium]|nr:orotidine-5'-phosphate decarboxylase [Planctomycetota bacterium]MBI3835787.1 orotidine-5'-phosphate decarboxylase [Planctomycetota bacterium]